MNPETYSFNLFIQTNKKDSKWEFNKTENHLITLKKAAIHKY
jgi:hypothetical protein